MLERTSAEVFISFITLGASGLQITSPVSHVGTPRLWELYWTAPEEEREAPARPCLVTMTSYQRQDFGQSSSRVTTYTAH